MNWKDIPGLEEEYQASNNGDIRSLDRTIFRKSGPVQLRGKLLRLVLNGNGYYVVNIKGSVRKVHRLVASAFIGVCPNGQEVRHGPRGKSNNSVNNLSYGTRSQNQLDRRRDGTFTTSNRAVLRSDGIKFPTVTEAALSSGTHKSDISATARGKRKTAGGYKWRYTSS